MKKIEYFNEQLDKADKEYISDMIRDHLADMEISPCSFSYEIHVNYEEDENWNYLKKKLDGLMINGMTSITILKLKICTSKTKRCIKLSDKNYRR